MLYTINYILEPNIKADFARSLRNVSVAVYLDLKGMDIPEMLYELINQFDLSVSFTLFINKAGNINDTWLKSIVPLFFFSNYKKNNGIPQLLLSAPCTPNRMEIDLKAFAKAQGFQCLEILYPVNEWNKSAILLNSANKEEIKRSYQHQLDSLTADSVEFFIPVSTKEDIDSINESILDIENEFTLHRNDMFVLMKQMKELRVQLSRSELILGAAEQEILALNSHIDYLRSNAEASGILNYYNNEYEILPKWYKQFGHIIKVIKGKRSLRSLFGGKVKKYKQ